MALKDLKEIQDSEVSDKRIHQLPVRPNQRSIYGAPGLTGKELQEKYDEYAELLRQHFNELINVLVESISQNKNGISPIAQEIMVKLNESADSTSSLDEAMQDLFEMIKENEDFMLGVIGDTRDYKSTIIADIKRLLKDVGDVSEAVSIAESAMIKAKEAEGYATTAQIDAGDAKTTALQASRDALTAKNIADDAHSLAEEAKTIAESSVPTITFPTEETMNSWIDSKKIHLVDNLNIGQYIPSGSTVVFSVDDNDEESINACNWEFNGYLQHTDGSVYKRNGRAFLFTNINEVTIVLSYEAEFLQYDGTYAVYYNENARCDFVDKICNSPDDVPDEVIEYKETITYEGIEDGTHFYVLSTNKNYIWNGFEAVEIGAADLSEVKNGLQSILDAVNGILEGGAS